MKKLSQFTLFDWDSFQKGKVFVCTGVTELKNYDTQEHIGTKVEVVIAKDETEYTVRDGEAVTNLYEKLIFKVNKDIDIPLNAVVQPQKVTCTVYGEFKNQLSCFAEDIIIVPNKQN